MKLFMNGTPLGLRIIKIISDLNIFTEIVHYIWQKIGDFKAQINFWSDAYFFSGHFGIKTVTHVKKIKFSPNMSKRDGGHL